MKQMLNLPDNNPFSEIILVMFWMDVIRTILTLSTLGIAIWFVYRTVKAEKRQDRILSLAENYAELSKHRREDAKAEITAKLEEKAEEIKKEVAAVPVKVAQITGSGSTEGDLPTIK